ncbi:MAG TPA: hypothetical protein VN622_02265 [Clostridia bacterium]|nr:hypothetical protein [Clostridia bacterium]
MGKRRIVLVLAQMFVVLFALCGVTALFGADKKQRAESPVVDSGSFGIFVGGRRVATETFTIKQQPDVSIATSELKVDDGKVKATQTSRLELTPSGTLRKYEWRELSPGKSQATVEPSDQFLVERTVVNNKTVEQPFLVPASSMVLDDYFFSHREILAWRYLGSTCKVPPGGTSCELPKSQFGIVVPRQRTAAMISIEFKGREQVNIRGQEMQLSRFNLEADGGNWAMWLDSNHKLIRIVIDSDGTEVVRD